MIKPTGCAGLGLIRIGSALAVAVVAIMAFSLWPMRLPQVDYWPKDCWKTASLESEGIDSVKLALALNTIQQNGIPVHSLMMIRRGRVILDGFFYPYDRTTLHDMASVTKSFTTTLIGIAADEGLLDLDQPILSFFPGRTVANRDEWKEQITVRHLVSMSSGLDCNNERGDNQSVEEMVASKDWVQFVLDLKVTHEPGTVFEYFSPGTHLLSAILTHATGMSALEFAKQNLFGPLGITKVYWPADPAGITYGWGGLCLLPQDAAKLGYLWLNDGVWDERQIVSHRWVENAVKSQVPTGSTNGYGYGWWLNAFGGSPSYKAFGAGGQEVLVVPGMDLVIVKTGGGYDPQLIDSLLEKSIVDRNKSVPENPEGEAQLQKALASIIQEPVVKALRPLPDIAREISGKTFVFEPNYLLKTATLAFVKSDEAQLDLKVVYESEPRLNMVGLDGLYRKSLQGPPIMARGEWVDNQTFSIQYNTGPSLVTVQMRFEQDQLHMEISGFGSFIATMHS
jgi:CubicO group peptidase (beta-lactamase class C family)